MLRFIRLLITKYRLDDLIFYFFSKNKFKNHFTKSEIIINNIELKDIFTKYSKLINKNNQYSKIWQNILGHYYKDLSNCFNNQDFDKFKKIMNIFLKDKVIRGAEDGNLYKNSILEISHKVILIKAIYSISKHLNIMSYLNPYQPEVIKENKILDLYKKIQDRIPISKLPMVGSPYGYKFEDSVINWRFLESVYWNLTIKNFLSSVSINEKINILEIGSGSGLNPFIFFNFFKEKIDSIYLIDIPQILLFQEFYIKNSLYEKKLENKFFFVPNSNLNSLDKIKFNIFLNKDSFPEISDTEANEYLKFISTNSGSYLFSVNHESKITHQKSMSDRIKKFSNISLVSRDEFPIRKGYVKEIYYIS